MSKKRIFAVALAICLVAVISMGTLAWFSAEDTIENNFHFADSDDDGNTDFSVEVFETDENGDPTSDGLVFNNILPGDKLAKDPTIKNTSTAAEYSQYIRATVTLKDPTGAWKKAFDEGRIGWSNGANYLTLASEMFKTIDQTYPNGKWDLAEGGEGTAYGYDANAKEFFWVYYLRGTLEAGKEVTLFEEVVIPTGLTVEDASAMKSDFDVTVKAEAVQSKNLGLESYQGAKDAFKVVGMELEAR